MFRGDNLIFLSADFGWGGLPPRTFYCGVPLGKVGPHPHAPPHLQAGKVFKNAGLLGPRVKTPKNDLLNNKFRRHEQGLKFLGEAKLTHRLLPSLLTSPQLGASYPGS